MKLTDLLKKTALERNTYLYDTTRGWDKYLLIELLNEQYGEIHDILDSKYKTIQHTEEEERFLFLPKFYFRIYYLSSEEIQCNIYYESYDVPEDDHGWYLYNTVEMLDSILINDCLTEDEVKRLPDHQFYLKTPKNKFDDYCEVGSLFAQGFIKINGAVLTYNGEVFKSAYELEKHLKEKGIVTVNSVRHVIASTYNKDSKKSVYNSTRAENIIKYCEEFHKPVVQEYLDTVEAFKPL